VVELRGEGLVRRDDERRLADARNHVRDRERLSAAGDAEQHLVWPPLHHAGREGVDGLRLVAGRRKVRLEAEGNLTAHDPPMIPAARAGTTQVHCARSVLVV
jgi:hypothetical protein